MKSAVKVKERLATQTTRTRCASGSGASFADLGELTPKTESCLRANFYRFNRAKDKPAELAELVAHTIPQFPSTCALWLPGV